jgi:hypothetical protein
VAVPLVEPASRALTRPAHRALAAVGALAVLGAAGAAALFAIAPPAARGADAPTGEFGAGRAHAQVEVIAAATHVAGGTTNDGVREHLLTTLRGYGLTPEVQDTVTTEGGSLSSSEGATGMARVRNVVTLLPGTAPGTAGRVFLVAHYDSVQTGPGGNDDAAGVATVLETARALTTGPRLRNDVVLVLTDAEEACLCGAAAFVGQHPLARDGGVVLNLEARGSSGPAIMFETSQHNAGLVGVYAQTPHPVGTSFAVEIYRLLPNDTDFTPFREAGFAGLNTAYIDGAAVYHTPLDTPSSMDIDSLQHHGDNALALTRRLGGTDLGSLQTDGDATYFPAPWGLVLYPGSLTWPLAGVALLAVLVLAVSGRRRGLFSWPRLLGGVALGLLPIAVTPVLAQLFWAGMVGIRPGYATLLDPYRPMMFRLAVLALTVTVLCGWYALFRRRVGPAAIAVGGLVWLAVFGLVLAFLVPGGSYLAALPALAGAVAGLVAIRVTGWWAVLAVTLGGAVAVIVLLPAVVLLFPALGMAMGGVGALLAVLLGLALLPIVDLLHPEAGVRQGIPAWRARRRGPLPALLAFTVFVALAGAGLRIDRFDAAHPSPTHLMYALDTDTGTARWLSNESTPQPWTRQYVSGPPRSFAATPQASLPPLTWPPPSVAASAGPPSAGPASAVAPSAGPASDLGAFPALGSAPLLSGPATAAALPAPQVTVIGDDRAGDTRRLRIRVLPQRQVRLVAFHSAATFSQVVVGGRTVSGERGLNVVFHAPPAEGVEVLLIRTSTDPIKLRVMDASDGLTALPGFRPRPADVGVVGSHSSEMVAVARTYSL